MGTIKSSPSGSSPRRRGTLRHHGIDAAPHRFIPAQAGNTLRARGRNAVSAVHPRAGGEHMSSRCRRAPRCGSSPRRRGTLVLVLDHAGNVRFIPAQAGNTGGWRWRLSPGSVHPRAGGEHREARAKLRAATGSSPRRRGTQQIAGGIRNGCRFIPAQAGNTLSGSDRAIVATVHPRAGGEHTNSEPWEAVVVGSSPRRRGTLIVHHHGNIMTRFIPAQAGNTAPGRTGSGARAVHPRAGGEHLTHPVRSSG